MPDSSITAPVVADPIDRLTLGATDARVEWASSWAHMSGLYFSSAVCFAEE